MDLAGASLYRASLARADLSRVLLTGASWSTRTTWPDETILIAAASQPIDGNRFRIGELRLD